MSITLALVLLQQADTKEVKPYVARTLIAAKYIANMDPQDRIVISEDAFTYTVSLGKFMCCFDREIGTISEGNFSLTPTDKKLARWKIIDVYQPSLQSLFGLSELNLKSHTREEDSHMEGDLRVISEVLSILENRIPNHKKGEITFLHLSAMNNLFVFGTDYISKQRDMKKTKEAWQKGKGKGKSLREDIYYGAVKLADFANPDFLQRLSQVKDIPFSRQELTFAAYGKID
jgi:hypothetical protein